jgi:serine/threonine-protein kinase HipA
MRLLIYREEQLVGELYTTDSGINFKYDSNYRGTGAYPLSISLPIQSEAYSQKQALPFFEGLLPEGEQRSELGSILHVSTTSTMSLLKALAGECVGNLMIIDEDTTISSILEVSSYTLLELEELEALLRPQSIERINFVASKRLSLAGAQAKFGLYREGNRWYAPNGLAPTTHIIKPVSLFDPTLFINEFFTMRLAKHCGIEVPDVSIIHIGEYYGYCVERFDRLRINGRVIRLGQEDFCQALAVMPDAKYENDGGPGFAELFTATLRYTSRPIQNVQKLLSLVLFNYLIGNCDAHGKNFSLLHEPGNGSLSLAPAYDLISTTFYGDRLLQSMAMRIGEHSRIDRITVQDFIRFSEETSISLDAISTEMRSLRDLISNHVDDAVDDVGKEANEFSSTAEQLRTHFLDELTRRVVLS